MKARAVSSISVIAGIAVVTTIAVSWLGALLSDPAARPVEWFRLSRYPGRASEAVVHRSIAFEKLTRWDSVTDPLLPVINPSGIEGSPLDWSAIRRAPSDEGIPQSEIGCGFPLKAMRCTIWLEGLPSWWHADGGAVVTVGGWKRRAEQEAQKRADRAAQQPASTESVDGTLDANADETTAGTLRVAGGRVGGSFVTVPAMPLIVPLEIVWLPFTINVFLYAVAIMGLSRVGSIWRHCIARWGIVANRRRKGLCVFCKYPRPAGASVCPECGRA